MLNKIISSKKVNSAVINFLGSKIEVTSFSDEFTVKDFECQRITPFYNAKEKTASDGLVIRIVSGTFIPAKCKILFDGAPIAYFIKKLVLEVNYTRHTKFKSPQKDYIQKIQLTYSSAVLNSRGDFTSFTPKDTVQTIYRQEFNNHGRKHSSELFKQRFDAEKDETTGFDYIRQEFDEAGKYDRMFTAEFATENPDPDLNVDTQFIAPFNLSGKGTIEIIEPNSSSLSRGTWRDSYTEKNGFTLDLETQTLLNNSNAVRLLKTGGYQHTNGDTVVYGDIHSDSFDESGTLTASVSGCVLEDPPLFLEGYSELKHTRVQSNGEIQYYFPAGILQLRTSYLFKITSPVERMYCYSDSADRTQSNTRCGRIKARITDLSGQCLLQFSVKIKYTSVDSHLIVRTSQTASILPDFLEKFRIKTLSSFPKNYETYNPREKRDFILKKIDVIETEIKITTKYFLCASENTSAFDTKDLLELLVEAHMQLSTQLQDDFFKTPPTILIDDLPSIKAFSEQSKRSKAALNARLEKKEQKKAEKKRRHEEWVIRQQAIEKETAADFSAKLKNVTETCDFLSQNFDSSGLQLPLRLDPKTTTDIESLSDIASELNHYMKEFKDVLGRFQALIKKDKNKEYLELKEYVTQIKSQIKTIQNALTRYNTYYKQCRFKWQTTCRQLNFLERPEDRGLKREEIKRLREEIQNPDLAYIFNQNYREGASINDGSTAGIIIEESIQKIPIYCPTGHLMKGIYLLNQLHSIYIETLNAFDRSLYFQIISDLQYAVSLSARGNGVDFSSSHNV